MSTFTTNTEISMNTDTEMNLYQITAARIAAAARTAYPDREIKVVHAGRIVCILPKYYVATDHEGITWGEYGTGTEYVAWDDPHFEKLVAARISELIGEPFPADWMEAGL